MGFIRDLLNNLPGAKKRNERDRQEQEARLQREKREREEREENGRRAVEEAEEALREEANRALYPSGYDESRWSEADRKAVQQARQAAREAEERARQATKELERVTAKRLRIERESEAKKAAYVNGPTYGEVRERVEKEGYAGPDRRKNSRVSGGVRASSASIADASNTTLSFTNPLNIASPLSPLNPIHQPVYEEPTRSSYRSDCDDSSSRSSSYTPSYSPSSCDSGSSSSSSDSGGCGGGCD